VVVRGTEDIEDIEDIEGWQYSGISHTPSYHGIVVVTAPVV